MSPASKRSWRVCSFSSFSSILITEVFSLGLSPMLLIVGVNAVPIIASSAATLVTFSFASILGATNISSADSLSLLSSPIASCSRLARISSMSPASTRSWIVSSFSSSSSILTTVVFPPGLSPTLLVVGPSDVPIIASSSSAPVTFSFTSSSMLGSAIISSS